MVEKNNILYAFLSVIAVFFFINRFLVLITVGLVVILFSLMTKEDRLSLYMTGITKVFVVISVMCLFYFVLTLIPGFSALGSSSYAIKELSRCIIYILIVQILLRIKVDTKIYIRVWNLLLMIAVVVAILQFTKIIDMNTILKNFYGESVQYTTAQQTELSSFRCGSIFVNPNVFSCFLVACLGSHLVISREYSCSFLNNLLVYALCIIGFVLSGSRTGFLLCIIIVIYHLITEYKSDSGYVFRFIEIMVISLAILCLVILVGGNTGILSDLRMFQVNEGMTNSVGIKFDIFGNLIKQMQAWNYLIGYGPFDYSVSARYLVDFDLGYFIVYYGIVGIGVYIALLKSLFHFESIAGNGNNKLPRMLLVIMIIFGFTAGTYFNLRIFVIYLLMFLPILAGDEQGIEA